MLIKIAGGYRGLPTLKCNWRKQRIKKKFNEEKFIENKRKDCVMWKIMLYILLMCNVQGHKYNCNFSFFRFFSFQQQCTCHCTSTISVFVLLSCGSLYSVYLRRILSISVLAYWNSLLPELKIIRAISQSHRMLSSYAFFINPNLRLVKVT